MSDRTYWATEPAESLVAALKQRIKDYEDALKDTGRLELWSRAVRMFYGMDADGGWKRSHGVRIGGEQGELVGLRINEFASLVRHVHTLITGNRPALQARAANDNPESYEQTILAEGLLEFYGSKGRIEDSQVMAAEWALVQGEGWHEQTWDVWAGRPMGVHPETGGVVYEGDVRAVPREGIDVIRDPGASFLANEQPDWLMVRRRVSRWELMQRYTTLADDIADMKAIDQSTELQLWTPATMNGRRARTDYVYVYDFYHAKTIAMPQGRMAVMVGDAIAFDGPLPYDEIPLYPIMPAIERGTPFGYTHQWDLMGPQECLDAIASTMQTNYDAFGVVNITYPQGGVLDVVDLAGGLRGIPRNPAVDEPKVLAAVPASKEGMELVGFHRHSMELMSGINETARGGGVESAKSGSHAALLQAMAVQFNSGLHRSYGRLLERAGNGLLRILQTFVSTEREAEIAGRDASPRLQKWTGEDLSDVTGVIVELANPMSQTVAGRREMADAWVANGWVQTPEQWGMVVSSGRLEPLYKRDRDHRRLIAAENERLRRGQQVAALFTDRHTIHIQEHLCVLDDPDVRFDDARNAAALAHITEHIQLRMELAMSNPDMLAMIGEPPPVMAMPGAPMPGAPANENGGPAQVDALPENVATGPGGEGPALPSLPSPAGGEVAGGMQ